jgi:hypothetical protein
MMNATVIIDGCEMKGCEANGTGGVVWGVLGSGMNTFELMNTSFEECVATSCHGLYIEALLTSNQNFKFFDINLIYSGLSETIFYLIVPSLNGIRNDENLNIDTFTTFRSKFKGWCVETTPGNYDPTHFIVHDNTDTKDDPLTSLICKSIFFFFSLF